MSLIVYGIPNCDTVKKARAWLDARGTVYAFHDYKKLGVDAAALDRWIAARGWETVLNRSGMTFRKLPAAESAGLDRSRAAALMMAHPSAIRRPIVEGPGLLLIGFKPDDWSAAFA
jgi:arsenate reductase (glutaredoxin)